MLPNLAVTFSSLASSVFSDVWPCWPFLPSWCIFLSWLPALSSPGFPPLSCSFLPVFPVRLLFLISKYGELHSSARRSPLLFSLLSSHVVSCPALESHLPAMPPRVVFSVSLSCELYSRIAAWNLPLEYHRHLSLSI